jgi:hypothetical protein
MSALVGSGFVAIAALGRALNGQQFLPLIVDLLELSDTIESVAIEVLALGQVEVIAGLGENPVEFCLNIFQCTKFEFH